jgi:hypothetical protein
MPAGILPIPRAMSVAVRSSAGSLPALASSNGRNSRDFAAPRSRQVERASLGLVIVKNRPYEIPGQYVLAGALIASPALVGCSKKEAEAPPAPAVEQAEVPQASAPAQETQRSRSQMCSR